MLRDSEIWFGLGLGQEITLVEVGTENSFWTDQSYEIWKILIKTWVKFLGFAEALVSVFCYFDAAMVCLIYRMLLFKEINPKALVYLPVTF